MIFACIMDRKDMTDDLPVFQPDQQAAVELCADTLQEPVTGKEVGYTFETAIVAPACEHGMARRPLRRVPDRSHEPVPVPEALELDDTVGDKDTNAGEAIPQDRRDGFCRGLKDVAPIKATALDQCLKRLMPAGRPWVRQLFQHRDPRRSIAGPGVRPTDSRSPQSVAYQSAAYEDADPAISRRILGCSAVAGQGSRAA